jgi:hypothetical protein
LKPDRDVRVRRLEQGQYLRQHAGRCSRHGAKRHRTAAQICKLIEVLLEPAQVGEDLPGSVYEHLSLRRRDDAARVTLEQSELQHVFELLQVLRQGRLTDTQHNRRLEETAVGLQGIHDPQHREPHTLVEVSAGHADAAG